MSAVIDVRPAERAGDVRRSRRPLVAGVIASVGIVVAVAVRICLESPPAFMDLDVYRRGVVAWWSGRDMYGPLFPTVANNFLPFIYPPFAVLFLGPLAALPWTVSAVVMLAISLGALALVIYLSVRSAWPARAFGATVVLLPLALTMEPVWDTLWFGQVNLLLMAMVALDCLTERPQWRRGVLVGIAAAVKLTPGVFVLYFLLRKDYRAAATAAVTGLAATLVGFLVSWHGSLEFWFGPGKGARGVSGSAYFSNQTVDGFFARLTSLHSVQNPLWLSVVAVVLVVAVAAVRRANAMGEPALAMAAVGCFGLIASPTSWGHHWVYAVPGLVAIGCCAVRFRDLRWAVAGGVTAVVFAVGPYRLLPTSHAAYLRWNWWQQLVGNSYVLVGVALLAMLAVWAGGGRSGASDSSWSWAVRRAHR